MTLEFLWIPQKKKFHYEISKGTQSLLSIWLTPGGGRRLLQRHPG
jgi:hypothetical protein